MEETLIKSGAQRIDNVQKLDTDLVIKWDGLRIYFV